MLETTDLPRKNLTFTTMQIVDWEGPIVEVLFHRPLVNPADVDRLMIETRGFMDVHVEPRGIHKAYFLTCYEGFSVSRENLQRLQESFLEFNSHYSKGDVRYGGSLVAKTLVFSTSIRANTPSEIYPTREQALEHLRTLIRSAADRVG